MPYLELPQGSIWYEQQGSGEPLILLHGGAVDSRFFEHNVGPLGERFRVIATDLWGHGRTADRAGPFSLESFSTDVAALIEGPPQVTTGWVRIHVDADDVEEGTPTA